MFRKIDDFKTTWEREIEFTRKVFDALTDQSLEQPIADNHRTLGHIAWHIVITIPEMTGRTGLKFTAVAEHDPIPKSAAEIATKFQAAA
ncbi:hypothetical protein GF420_09865, partial [candidate division GN15 bacterium]|nr:hypothetical protein [candidate division GN15 bacterium]